MSVKVKEMYNIYSIISVNIQALGIQFLIKRQDALSGICMGYWTLPRLFHNYRSLTVLKMEAMRSHWKTAWLISWEGAAHRTWSGSMCSHWRFTLEHGLINPWTESSGTLPESCSNILYWKRITACRQKYMYICCRIRIFDKPSLLQF